MEYETFRKLLAYVVRDPASQKQLCGGHAPVPPDKALMVCLWYLAKQETLSSIGQRFGLVPSTVYNVVNVILKVLNNKKRQFIFWPKTQQEITTVQEEFHNYPDVLGAIDGTHIRIKAPERDQDSYLDRHHNHSIIVLAVCTKKKFFRYINAGWPGSAHDSRVLHKSALYTGAEAQIEHWFPQNTHLVGDSAFPCMEWLMTPYSRRNVTPEERLHNTVLSKDRVAIENAFKLLKGRWRILQFINVYSIHKAVQIIIACCVLHNFCLLNNDLCDDMYDEPEDAPADVEPSDRRRGLRKRDAIKRRLSRQRQ